MQFIALGAVVYLLDYAHTNSASPNAEPHASLHCNSTTPIVQGIAQFVTGITNEILADTHVCMCVQCCLHY